MKRLISFTLLFFALMLGVSFTTPEQRRELIWDRVMADGTPNMYAGWDANGDPVELSGGGLSSGAANEIQKGDGAGGFDGTGLLSSTDGDLILGIDAGTNRFVTAGSSGANASIRIKSKGTGAATLYDGNETNYLSVGSTQVTGRTNSDFYLESSTALTNSVSTLLSVVHNTSGVHAAGIGSGLRFGTETAASNIEYGSILESVSTDITSTSEDFDLVFKTMSAGATASEKLRLTSDGRLYGKALHNNAGALTGTTNQYIASGTYTPTLAGSLNISSTTSAVCVYVRVGNCVFVSGVVQATPTAGGNADTTFTMSLPIASDFTLQGDAGGSAGAYNFNLSTAIIASSPTDVVSFRFLSPGTSVINFAFHFMYLIK